MEHPSVVSFSLFPHGVELVREWDKVKCSDGPLHPWMVTGSSLLAGATLGVDQLDGLRHRVGIFPAVPFRRVISAG
jgi:hypothetical protein